MCQQLPCARAAGAASPSCEVMKIKAGLSRGFNFLSSWLNTRAEQISQLVLYIMFQ